MSVDKQGECRMEYMEQKMQELYDSDLAQDRLNAIQDWLDEYSDIDCSCHIIAPCHKCESIHQRN